MLKSFGSVILLCAISSAATADVITFETAPLGPSVSFVLGGVTFSTVGLNGAIIRQTTPNGTQGIIDNNSPHLELRADFSSLQNFVSVDLGDFNSDADLLVLRAFNSSNGLIGFGSIPIDAALHRNAYAIHLVRDREHRLCHIRFGGSITQWQLGIRRQSDLQYCRQYCSRTRVARARRNGDDRHSVSFVDAEAGRRAEAEG